MWLLITLRAALHVIILRLSESIQGTGGVSWRAVRDVLKVIFPGNLCTSISFETAAVCCVLSIYIYYYLLINCLCRVMQGVMFFVVLQIMLCSMCKQASLFIRTVHP